jgi:hypothetical protein
LPDPEEFVLTAGTLLQRVYFQGPRCAQAWGEFLHFGPSIERRFDHHIPPPQRQDRGVLYCATEPGTCLGEAFERSKTINRQRDDPFLAMFELTRDVPLLDLCKKWPDLAGAGSAIGSGSRDRARTWSIAIYEEFPGIQGLLYRSCVPGSGFGVTLYERARTAIPAAPVFDRPLSDQELEEPLRDFAEGIRYGLL